MCKPLLIAVLVANTILHAAPAVTLKISPYVQFAPGFIRATIIIEPNATNRAYCFVYEGTYSGETCRELAGITAEHTRWVELKDLPPGEYVGVIVLTQVEGGKRREVRSGAVKWQILESVPLG